MWPSDEDLARVPWASDSPGADLPSYRELIGVLRPVNRACFLLGYSLDGFHVAVGASGDWLTVDVMGLTPPLVDLLTLTREAGFTIRLDAAPFFDAGPGVTSAVDESVLSLPSFGGSGGWSAEADNLATAIELFVADAVAALLPHIGLDGVPDRAAGTGLVWIFDPQHWEDAQSLVSGDLTVPLEPLKAANVHVFLTDQISGFGDTERTQVANLDQVLSLTGNDERQHEVWEVLVSALTARGERHRLNDLVETSLTSFSSQWSWLDSLFVSLREGYLAITDLVEPAPPPDPITAELATDSRVDLLVWNRYPITVQRKIPAGEPILGAVAWDYANGDRNTLPTVIIVAGRGIEITVPDELRYPPSADAIQYGQARSPVLKLEVYRVQDDQLVPPHGGAINPQLMLAPAFVGSQKAAMIKPKPDGVVVVFPVVGQVEIPVAGMPTDGVIRSVVDLTVDPYSAEDGYEIDIDLYTYATVANLPAATSAHLTVRATEAVDIASNRSMYGNDDLAVQLAEWFIGGDIDFGRGVITNDAENHVTYAYNFDSWSFSAEFWRVIDPAVATAGSIDLQPHEALSEPFRIDRPVLDAAVYRTSDLPTPRLTQTRTWEIGQSTITSYTDGDIDLFPASHRYAHYGYTDSLVFDLIDVAIGFVPIIGDAVDIAETVLAWQTGRDKWGRPVSNFQLTLMMLGASVPFVSAGFARRAGEIVEESSTVFRSGVLDFTTRHVVPSVDGLADDAAAVVGNTRIWTETPSSLLPNLGDLLPMPASSSRLVTNVAGAGATIALAAERMVRPAAGTSVRATDFATDSGSGSWLHTFAVGLRRANRTTTDIVEVADLVDGPTAGAAWRVGRALVRNANELRPRLPVPYGRYGSEMRGLIRSGPTTNPANWSENQLVDLIGAAIEVIAEGGPAGRVVSGGALHQAADVVHGVGAVVTRANVAALLAAAGRRGDPNVSAMVKLVGREVAGGNRITDQERALRVTKALYSAAAELSDNGLGTADRLFTPTMLPLTGEFVQKFVVRYGYEHGLRFEIRQGAVTEVLVGRSGGVRHQFDMPNMRGNVVSSGPDTIIYINGQAFFVQYKAFINFGALFSGAFKLTMDGSRIKKVTGPAFPKQHAMDHVRVGHIDNKVPPVGWTGRITPGMTPGSDWVEVGPTSLHIMDDVYLMNSLVTLFISATQRTGRSSIDVMTELRTSERTRAAMVEALDMVNALDAGRLRVTDDIYGQMSSVIRHVLPEFQDEVNGYFSHVDVVAAMGRETNVVFAAATDAIENAPHLLLGRN